MVGNKFHDTIYVTANPFGAEVSNDVFYNKYITFEDNDIKNPNKSWAPETVYQLASDAHDINRNKKMIVHFMQPHAPYFGKKAEKIRERLNNGGYMFWAWNEELSEEDKKQNKILSHLLSAAQQDLITVDELTKIYIENIEAVLEYVKKLVDEVDGKTIVTSDHGEMLRWKIGHGENIYTEGLRKVPWVVINDPERRDVIEEEPCETNDKNIKVNQQLRALGYT
jgi:hypothetical protein